MDELVHYFFAYVGDGVSCTADIEYFILQVSWINIQVLNFGGSLFSDKGVSDKKNGKKKKIPEEENAE